MREVRVGLIGTGYTGKAHAIAYAQAPTVFNLRGKLMREVMAEVSPELTAEWAQAFGLNRSTGDWRALVADPTIDVVDICSPNRLHKEMTLEAIRHGKHVYSEKPSVLNAHDVREVVETAQRAGVKTLVGFNYMKNPTAQLAGEITEREEIGEVIHFYGTRNENYMADPLAPIRWHCPKGTAGLGALDDLAAHIVNVTQYLVGGIQRVYGDLKVVVSQCPAKVGSSQVVTVENKDQAHTMVRFADGAQGVIEASCVACGRKMGLSYVITGTRGTIGFTQGRMAELKLYLYDDPANHQGFRTLLVGPAYPDYGAFCMGAGYDVGLNDQRTVEVCDLVGDIIADTPIWPGFEEGWKVSRVLSAIALSHQEGCWLNVNDVVWRGINVEKQFGMICIGRVAVNLYGQRIGARLEDVSSFAKYLGGLSGNVTYGTARQGLRSSMLARVGDEHMGRFLREGLNQMGCDTSHLITDKDRLTVLVLLGTRNRGTFPLTFYRDNCADIAITASDVDEQCIISARCPAITGMRLSHPQAHEAVLVALACT